MNKGILPFGLVFDTVSGAVSFATADAAAGVSGTTSNPIRALASDEMTASFSTTSLAPNVDLTAASTSVSDTNTAAAFTINSLTLESGATSVTLSPFQSMSLSSGAILVKAGDATITGGVLAQTASLAPLEIWTFDNSVTSTTSSLTISSVMTGGNGQTSGSAGLVKAGGGTLILSSPMSELLPTMGGNTMTGQTAVNQGTLVLNGGTNTLSYDNYLEVGLGGTVDLNGNVQTVFSLFSDGSIANGGGTVTGKAGSLLVANYDDNAARNFAGILAGALSFVRAGENTQTFYSTSTYTGSTLIQGGTTILTDFGALTNTSSLGVNLRHFDPQRRRRESQRRWKRRRCDRFAESYQRQRSYCADGRPNRF